MVETDLGNVEIIKYLEEPADMGYHEYHEYVRYPGGLGTLLELGTCLGGVILYGKLCQVELYCTV